MTRERLGDYDLRILCLLSGVIAVGYAALWPIYNYGTSNHTNQIPLVKHLINPDYLSVDWVTAVRTGFGTPRYFYLESVAAVGGVFGIPATYAVLWLLTMIVGVGGLFLFVREVFDDSLVALCVVGLTFSPVRDVVSVGGTNLFSSQFTPGPVGNALVLVGLFSLLRQSYWRAYLCFGAATVAHILVGTSMTGLATLALLATVVVDRRPSPSLGGLVETVRALPLGPMLLYAVVAAVGVGPVVLSNVGFEHSARAVYTMAWIRHPHHYVPSTWALWRHVLVVTFIVTGSALTWRTRHRVFSADRTATFCLSLATLVALFMYVGGWVFVEVVTIPTAVKLQAFRVQNYLFVILFGVFLSNGVYLVNRYGAPSVGVSTRTLAPVIAVLVFTAGFAAYGAVAGVNTDLVQGPDRDDQLHEAYDYIRTQTPEEARFLASPDKEGFRLYGERAMVVNIKSFPFSPPAMLEWKDRMDTVCGVDVGTYADPSAMAEGCKERFTGHDETEIRTLANRYDACWLLTERQDYGFDVAFANDEYAVYRISGAGSCSPGG